MTQKELQSTANTYRGMVIQTASIIERYFDLIISTYFCPGNSQKSEEFIGIMLGSNRISFDGKRKILTTILKKADKDFNTKYPNFNKDMTLFQAERNCFAHHAQNTSDEAVLRGENEIGLIKYSSNTRTDWYDEKRLTEIINAGSRCCAILSEIITNIKDLVFPLRRLPKNTP